MMAASSFTAASSLQLFVGRLFVDGGLFVDGDFYFADIGRNGGQTQTRVDPSRPRVYA